MYRASVTCRALLDEVSGSLGLFTPPTRAHLRTLLNGFFSRLYTEVVREIATTDATVTDGAVSVFSLSHPEGTAAIRPEDVCYVQAGLRQLHYLTPAEFPLFTAEDGRFYTLDGDALRVTLPEDETASLTVCYFTRPAAVTETNESTCSVPLPDEFLPLITSRLRGECYREAGEDEMAAKWLGDYNAILAEFREAVADGAGKRSR